MREVLLEVRIPRALLAALVASVALLAAGMAGAAQADDPPSAPEALSPRLIKQKNDKAKVKGATPVVITTAPERFAYAASIGIPEKFGRFASCDVTAVLRVTSGSIAVGALTRDQKTFVAQIAPVKPTPTRKAAPVTMKVSPMKDVGEIVFSNAEEKDGVASTVEVSKVTVGPCQ